jgi:hypothetical protein
MESANRAWGTMALFDLCKSPDEQSSVATLDHAMSKSGKGETAGNGWLIDGPAETQLWK